MFSRSGAELIAFYGLLHIRLIHKGTEIAEPVPAFGVFYRVFGTAVIASEAGDTVVFENYFPLRKLDISRGTYAYALSASDAVLGYPKL